MHSLNISVLLAHIALVPPQTSDGKGDYSRMLDLTQGVQLAYAGEWGYSYLRWDGVIRGNRAWLATYNRIYLLYDLLKEDKHDWVLFMDHGGYALRNGVEGNRGVDEGPGERGGSSKGLADQDPSCHPLALCLACMYARVLWALTVTAARCQPPDAVFVDPSQSVEPFLDSAYSMVACRGGKDDPKVRALRVTPPGTGSLLVVHPAVSNCDATSSVQWDCVIKAFFVEDRGNPMPTHAHQPLWVPDSSSRLPTLSAVVGRGHRRYLLQPAAPGD